MTRFDRILALSAGVILLGAPASSGALPEWAYPVNAPGETSIPDDGSARHVPDSLVTFSLSQIAAIDGPVPDWRPDEHPPMPAIVGNGRARVYACGYCHLPNGAGRPENASLAGLTPAYIRQEMLAFRSGERPGSEPRRLPQAAMIALAQSATAQEVEEAAAYFASLKPACFVRVVETANVPKTAVAGWVLTSEPGGGREPIGGRIIEMPVDFGRFERRDSRARYIAYVPVGSISLGADLAATGARGRSVACATCHGPELKGMADVPRLAGRSPSYLVRQLYDLRGGKRSGGASDLMKPVIAKLTDDDIVALAAYLASCEP